MQLSQKQYTYKSSLEQGKTAERQIPKKITILEVNGAQYKDSKSVASKIGETLAELCLPQIYDSIFLKLEQREEQKTIHVIHTNREDYNKPSTKEELTRVIQATKNSAPGPGMIHNEMLKRFPPEGRDSLLVMYNKKWHQGYIPEE